MASQDGLGLDAKRAKRRHHSYFDESKAEFSSLMNKMNLSLATIDAAFTQLDEQPGRPQPTAEPPLGRSRLPSIDGEGSLDPLIAGAPPLVAHVCVVAFDPFLQQGALATLEGLLARGVDIVVPYAVLNLIDDETTRVPLPDRDLTAPVPSHDLRQLLKDPTLPAAERDNLLQQNWQHSVHRGNATLRSTLMRDARNFLLRMLVETDRLDEEAMKKDRPAWATKITGRMRVQQRAHSKLPPQDSEGRRVCWCCWQGDAVDPGAVCPAAVGVPTSVASAAPQCVGGTIISCVRHLEEVAHFNPTVAEGAEHAMKAELGGSRRQIVLATEDGALIRMMASNGILAGPLHRVQSAASLDTPYPAAA